MRELLRARLEEEATPERLRELHAAVAPALLEEGRPDEAIEHWLAAEAWEEARGAISARGQQLAPTAPDSVRGWLAALPEAYRSSPSCLLLSGTLEWAEGNNAEAIELLRAAVAGFAAAGDAGGEWIARFALADPLSIVGLWEESIALADGYEQRAVAASRARSARSSSPTPTTALGATGRVAECRARSAELCAHPGAGARLRTARAIWEVYARSLSGDLDEAVDLFERKLAEVDQTDFMSRRPLASTGLALCLGDLGRDQDAPRRLGADRRPSRAPTMSRSSSTGRTSGGR